MCVKSNPVKVESCECRGSVMAHNYLISCLLQRGLPSNQQPFMVVLERVSFYAAMQHAASQTKKFYMNGLCQPIMKSFLYVALLMDTCLRETQVKYS